MNPSVDLYKLIRKIQRKKIIKIYISVAISYLCANEDRRKKRVGFDILLGIFSEKPIVVVEGGVISVRTVKVLIYKIR